MHSRLFGCLLVSVLVAACAGSSAPVDSKPEATSTSAPPPAATPASTAATAPAAAADPNVCPLSNADAWNGCVGKLVEVRGQTPKMVAQHPMMAPLSPPGGDLPTIHQSYLETAEGGQIIVLSREQNKCTGAMRVKGTLRAIDMGGPPKTKQSYKGWSIEDATITCE